MEDERNNPTRQEIQRGLTNLMLMLITVFSLVAAAELWNIRAAVESIEPAVESIEAMEKRRSAQEARRHMERLGLGR